MEPKLSRLPRFRETEIRAMDLDLLIPDSASFLSTYWEVFVEKIYAFEFSRPDPRILDLGANIGLSVCYFKKLFPGAEVIALEADPNIFRYLTENVSRNRLTGVTTINKAAWNNAGKLRFMAEGADGGRIAIAGDKSQGEVEAIDIGDLLRSQLSKGFPVDVLKIDIEGAEEAVLPACRGLLESVKYLFVEYHADVSRPQSLDLLLAVLRKEGFRFHIRSSSAMHTPQPFLKRQVHCGFDMQLDIFAWKERSSRK